MSGWVLFRGEDWSDQVGHGETALVIDTILPGTPFISSPRGTIWVGQSQVTVIGQASPLGQLQLLIDGSPASATVVDANGDWVLDQALPGAAHSLQAQLIDQAGNVSGLSNETVVQVDVTPPTVTLTAPPLARGYLYRDLGRG